jgi:hypothetical protein
MATTAQKLAAIRKQVEKISSMAKTASPSQKAAAAKSVQKAQKTVSSIKSSSSSSSKSSSKSSNSSSKKVSTTSDTTNTISKIKDQIKKIQEQVASGALTDKQRTDALKSVQSAQKQLKEMRDKVGQKEPFEEEEIELEEEFPEEFIPEEVAEDVRLPRVDVEIEGITYSLPKELVEGSHFKNADEMTKSLIAYTWGAIADQGHDINKVVNVLEIAAQQSDVYIKQQVRMFEDELTRSMGYIIEDYGVGKEVILRQMDYTVEDLKAEERLLDRRKRELKEDLEYNSANIEIDKQKLLGRQFEEYEIKVDNTREQLANVGLTFSSVRGRVEKLLEEAHKDVVEDITTKFERQERELNVMIQRQEKDIEYQKEQSRIQTERTQTNLQSQLKETQTNASRRATDILRRGERVLGTEKMKSIMPKMGTLPSFMNDFQQLGGIEATGLKEIQYSDILNRAQGLLG